MPLYEFECSECRARFETIDRVESCPKILPCPDCGGQAVKVISSRGAVHGDSPSWLNDFHVQNALQDLSCRGARPIESRAEHKAFMKKNGICEALKSGPRWI
jgi:putative FmdB family regulatory protein